MRCQLCSFEFDEKAMSCHASCSLNKNCAVICCPNCGHQSVDESRSKLAQILRQKLQRRPHGQHDPRATHAIQPPGAWCRLSDLKPGQSATVMAIESQNAGRLERLSIYGIVPGCELTLEQQRPTFVARVGFTELSFEREIADEILIEKLG
jgi:ferrous iron transport protein A